MAFEEAIGAIPDGLMSSSGKVFYSGRTAFARRAPLYVLGANPGGDPDIEASETVSSHTHWVATRAPENWSAYRDESWKGKSAGRHGMQPRMLHMFKVAGLDPGEIPSSNLVFVRSRRKENINEDFQRLANECWPFHEWVLKALAPRVILCLGQDAGDYVRAKVGAHILQATYTEDNRRRWASHAFRSDQGLRVVVATHPSIAKWNEPASDPTRLVAGALGEV